MKTKLIIIIALPEHFQMLEIHILSAQMDMYSGDLIMIT